jgi:hypothetical protein
MQDVATVIDVYVNVINTAVLKLLNYSKGKIVHAM